MPLPPPANTKPGLLAAGGALDSATPDIVMTLRAGVAGQPVLLRLGRLQARPRPRGAFRLRALSRRLRVRLVAHRRLPHRLGLQGSFRYIGERDGRTTIEGLDDVAWSAEAGLGVGYEQRNWRAFTDVRYGFVGHNAWVGELGADAIAYPIEGLTLTAGPRFQFGTDTFAQTYFGVSIGGIRRPRGWTTYDAIGGLLGAGVEIGARYLFNERWGVEGAIGLRSAGQRRGGLPDHRARARRTSTAPASASPGGSASTSEVGFSRDVRARRRGRVSRRRYAPRRDGG